MSTQWNPSSSTDLLRKLSLLYVFSDYSLYDVIPCCPLLFARVCGRVEGVSENDYWYRKKMESSSNQKSPTNIRADPKYLQRAGKSCISLELSLARSFFCVSLLTLLWSPVIMIFISLPAPGLSRVPACRSFFAPILVPSSLSCHSWAYLLLISHSQQCDSFQDSDMRSFHRPPTWSLEVSSGLCMIQTTKETILVILFQEDSSLFIFYFILT